MTSLKKPRARVPGQGVTQSRRINGRPGPSASAFLHANANASFKRAGAAPAKAKAKPKFTSQTSSTGPVKAPDKVSTMPVGKPTPVKAPKPSGTNKGPSAQAFAHANANASFKRAPGTSPAKMKPGKPARMPKV